MQILEKFVESDMPTPLLPTLMRMLSLLVDSDVDHSGSGKQFQITLVRQNMHEPIITSGPSECCRRYM